MKTYLFCLLVVFYTSACYSCYAQKAPNNIKYFDFVLENKIGDKNQDFLGFPYYIFIDAHKNICVTETKDICLKIYDSKGNLIKKLGQKGTGPGDFKWMQFVQNDSKGNLIIYDRFKRRLTTYDKSYNFIKTVNINATFDGLILLVNNTFLAVEIGSHNRSTQLTKHYLCLYSGDFKKLRTIDSLEINSTYEDQQGGFVYEYFDSFYFNKINDRNILLATGRDYKLRMFSQDAKKQFEKTINYNPVRLTQKERDDYLTANVYLGEKEKKIINSISKKPGIAAIIIDNSGKIFIKTNEEKNNSVLFDVFNSNGEYLFKAGFPKYYPYNKCVISDGRIYFIMLGDKTTPPSIGKYKIIEK